ncbi:unnamed protein product [Gadus morhua 'NCC']
MHSASRLSSQHLLHLLHTRQTLSRGSQDSLNFSRFVCMFPTSKTSVREIDSSATQERGRGPEAWAGVRRGQATENPLTAMCPTLPLATENPCTSLEMEVSSRNLCN